MHQIFLDVRELIPIVKDRSEVLLNEAVKVSINIHLTPLIIPIIIIPSAKTHRSQFMYSRPSLRAKMAGNLILQP